MTLYKQLFNALQHEARQIKIWRQAEREAIRRMKSANNEDDRNSAFEDYSEATEQIMHYYDIVSRELDAAYADVPFKATRNKGYAGFYRLLDEYLSS